MLAVLSLAGCGGGPLEIDGQARPEEAPTVGDPSAFDDGGGFDDGAPAADASVTEAPGEQVAEDDGGVTGQTAKPGRERDLLGPATVLRVGWTAAGQRAEMLRATQPEQARLLDKIATQPQALWLGGWSGDIRTAVATETLRSTDEGSLSVLVAYNILHRDCHYHSAGGASSAARYRAWIDALAEGIEDREAVVILEPDAIGLIDCLNAAEQEERFGLLAYAIERLARQPHVAVYLDAGHSDWLPLATVADRMTRAGVALARGFALNVSNFQRTEALVRYGNELSTLLGGEAAAHFVVDTSRNGLGPAQGPEAWCNPEGRALGSPPSTRTDEPLVDAFLWVKRPGESDGPCNGGPAAGAFWTEYALDLALRASW